MKYEDAVDLLFQNPQKILAISCLAHALERSQKLGARTVISLLETKYKGFLPQIENVSHHVFFIEDSIKDVPDGMEDTVHKIIQLGQRWKEEGTFQKTLVHCYGGVSRSTAAAYVLLCSCFPNIEEKQLFQIVTQKLTHKPLPNPLIAQLADTYLNAEGRILAPVIEYQNRYPERREAHIRRQRIWGIPHTQHV
ncbi:MAG: hypothetical protein AB7S81_07305 [Bdellovibrionales bacterium]